MPSALPEAPDVRMSAKLNRTAITAGALYLVVAIIAVAAFFRLEYAPGRFSQVAMLGDPGTMALAWAVCLLWLSSLTVGMTLLRRRRPSPPMLWLGGALVGVGFWWNWWAGLLWLIPLPFLWRAVRLRRSA